MGKELIEKVFKKFENHLNIEKNNRIVFSGKFGIGKSYFLNVFFSDEKYEKEYFPIFINPVNYSVSNNQDIFELIKFDILFQILEKNIIDFEDFDFPIGNLVYQYFSNKFLNDFISNIDLLGETVIEEQVPKSYSIIKNVGKLLSKISEINKGDFDNFKKEMESDPDLKIIKNFFDKEELKIGSLYENNAVSQLIYKLIKDIETRTEKKPVLVIDDLDRIDPEHIFRILNIFSAHDKLGENKFGFEKVILVCDINNIKHIYHHFYGEHVDFFGYINKFYSLEVFEYSNKDYAKWFNENFKEDAYRNGNIDFLGYILSDAISKNYISARQLFNDDFSRKGVTNFYNFSNSQNYDVLFKHKYINIFSLFKSTYILLKTIIRYFGDSNNFIKYVQNVEFNQLSKYQNVVGELYLFIDFKKEKNEDNNNNLLVTPYKFSINFKHGRFEFTGDFVNADLKSLLIDAIVQYNEIIEI
ncbi:P-loop NTPase fold protein [Chryseobacterium sp. Leaf394]|uniref:P-loop NTPase fold protein n=1 Tax=Chryseobacterium sp. Leaf394 TaxID=1736361 RepID=UPI0006F3EA9D|nr:P-loop NTPase fold protein [Chryseobacterium sp. Leaf394]KQS93608.1 hypothetical protein ASG21_01140 [Chryseobacterium sp. Leaf394]